MILLDVQQGSPEWHVARRGRPTASQFSRILTPTGKPSTSASGYLHELLAERLLDVSIGPEATDWMERGKSLEGEAVNYYELQREVDTTRAGFCLRDDRRVGCSADRLVGEDGGLEVKCPSAPVHIGYLLGDMPIKFQPQVQGSLWITGRAWWDLLSYAPGLPPALVRIPRDESYIQALADAVDRFLDAYDEALEKLSALARVNGAVAPISWRMSV